MTEAGAQATTAAARSGLQLVGRTAEAFGEVQRETAQRSAEATAELGRLFAELVSEQARHNVEMRRPPSGGSANWAGRPAPGRVRARQPRAVQPAERPLPRGGAGRDARHGVGRRAGAQGSLRLAAVAVGHLGSAKGPSREGRPFCSSARPGRVTGPRRGVSKNPLPAVPGSRAVVDDPHGGGAAPKTGTIIKATPPIGRCAPPIAPGATGRSSTCLPKPACAVPASSTPTSQISTSTPVRSPSARRAAAVVPTGSAARARRRSSTTSRGSGRGTIRNSSRPSLFLPAANNARSGGRLVPHAVNDVWDEVDGRTTAMAKRYRVTLTAEERDSLERMISRGEAGARERVLSGPTGRPAAGRWDDRRCGAGERAHDHAGVPAVRGAGGRRRRCRPGLPPRLHGREPDEEGEACLAASACTRPPGAEPPTPGRCACRPRARWRWSTWTRSRTGPCARRSKKRARAAPEEDVAHPAEAVGGVRLPVSASNAPNRKRPGGWSAFCTVSSGPGPRLPSFAGLGMSPRKLLELLPLPEDRNSSKGRCPVH